MKRVILDCDGVIVDFVKGYLNLLNKHGGTSYVHTDISDWDIVGCLKIPASVSDKADAEVTYDFCRNLSPIAGAVEGVRELMKHADVLFLTSPWSAARGWHTAREEWLYDHLKVKPRQVMHGSAKDWVTADVFVDDKASTVEAWQKAHPRSLSILWDQPWGRHSAHPLRTNSWEALLRLAT